MSPTVNRVVVLGCSGAGKSTITRRLVDQLGLPPIHLDREFWLPGWVETPTKLWRQRVAELAQRDRWVMDGNFAGTLDLRMPRADAVVLMDVPRRVCIQSVFARVVRHHGRVRADMAPGCPERFHAGFIRYVYNFNRDTRPKLVDAIYAHRLPTVRLESRAEATAWLDAGAVFPPSGVGLGLGES